MYKVFASFTVDARTQALALFAKHDFADPDRWVWVPPSVSGRQCCPLGACFLFGEEPSSLRSYMPTASMVADALVDQDDSRREYRAALASAAAFIGKWDSCRILTIDDLRAAMGLTTEGF